MILEVKEFSEVLYTYLRPMHIIHVYVLEINLMILVSYTV